MGRKLLALGALVGFAWASVEAPNPYHPYPIIFVHGFATNSECFGVKPDSQNINRIDSSYHENGYTHGYDPHDTYGYFMNYMMPYILANPWGPT